MKTKMSLKRKVAFIMAAIMMVSTLGFFALGDPQYSGIGESSEWAFTGGGTAHTRFALRNQRNGHLVGTFCMAINIFGIGQNFDRVTQGDMETYVELSPLAIAEIRYAVALIRTLYIGNHISRELAEERLPAHTLTRPLGPELAQALLWTRMAMETPRFWWPENHQVPGGWYNGRYQPFSPEEINFFFGRNMINGQTLAQRLNPNDTADIVVTPAFSGTMTPNAQGLIGPFTLTWSPGSAQSLIDLNHNPTFSIEQGNWARMVVYNNGLYESRQRVGIGEEFYIEPRVFGTRDINIMSNSSIIRSMNEFFFLHSGQPQYGLEFDIWEASMRFHREEPNDMFQKQVQEYGVHDNEWYDHIYLDPGDRGLFRIVFNNIHDDIPVRLQFSEHPPVECNGGSGPYDEDTRIQMDPIPIFNAQQLQDMRLRANRDHELRNNICLCSHDNWFPINHFTATLYGNNFTISNLTSTRIGSNGLFLGLNGTHIYDLRLRDFNIHANIHDRAAGALAAYAHGFTVINNVHAYNINISASNNAGGLIGIASANSASYVKIENSSVQGINIEPHPDTPLNSNTALLLGGLIGALNGNIINSHVRDVNITVPNVSSTQNSGDHNFGGVGGLVGRHFIDGKIENASVTNITIHSAIPKQGYGGVVGHSRGGSYNNITVKNVIINIVNPQTPRHQSSTSIHIGGLIGTTGYAAAHLNTPTFISNVAINGFTAATIGAFRYPIEAGGFVSSRSTVNIDIQSSYIEDLDFNFVFNTSTTNTHIGGIIGATNHDASIENVFASGRIFTQNTYINPPMNTIYLGGIAGVTSTTTSISNVISNVEIEATVNIGNIIIGGLIGQRNAFSTLPLNIVNSFAAGAILSATTSSEAWVGQIVGRPVTSINLNVYAMAYENMLINVNNEGNTPSPIHGNPISRIELYNQATYITRGFDFNTIWHPPNNDLPRLRATGAPAFTFPTIPAFGPCSSGNGNGNGNGDDIITLWVRDFFDGTRLTNDDFLVRVGTTNTFITLREWAEQQDAANNPNVIFDENGDIIIVTVPPVGMFTFYYRTGNLPEGHFVNTVYIGPPRDSASITVRERHRARDFYLRVRKYSHSFMDAIEDGWIFRLQRDGVHVAYISNTDRIRLTTPGVYTLREVQAPEGHILDTSIVWTFTFTGNDIILGDLPTLADGVTVPGGWLLTPEGANVNERELVISVINRPYFDPCPDTELWFIKADDENRPLAGARFALYRYDEQDGWVRRGGPNAFTVSEANGHVRFTNLQWDSQYRLVEILAPDGFVTPTGFWLIDINRSGVMVITPHGDVPAFIFSPTLAPQGAATRGAHGQWHPPLVPNARTENVNFEFVKTNSSNALLSGAVFALYENVAGTWTRRGSTVTSTASGTVLFTGLTRGTTYRLVEVTAPTNHWRPTGHWYVIVDNDGNITVTPHGDAPEFDWRMMSTADTEETFVLPNYRLFNWTFVKTNYHDQPLAGAVFQLYELIDDVWVARGGTITSDASGIVTLTGLREGARYRLREVSAPAGFATPDGHWYIDVNAPPLMAQASSSPPTMTHPHSMCPPPAHPACHPNPHAYPTPPKPLFQ